MKRLRRFFKVKAVHGQSLTEYGLVLALVAVVAIGSLTVLGNSIKGMLSGLATQIAAQPTGSPSPSTVSTAGGYCNGGSCGSVGNSRL